MYSNSVNPLNYLSLQIMPINGKRPSPFGKTAFVDGGDGGARTRDHMTASHVRSHLRYIPITFSKLILPLLEGTGFLSRKNFGNNSDTFGDCCRPVPLISILCCRFLRGQEFCHAAYLLDMNDHVTFLSEYARNTQEGKGAFR